MELDNSKRTGSSVSRVCTKGLSRVWIEREVNNNYNKNKRRKNNLSHRILGALLTYH